MLLPLAFRPPPPPLLLQSSSWTFPLIILSPYCILLVSLSLIPYTGVPHPSVLLYLLSTFLSLPIFLLTYFLPSFITSFSPFILFLSYPYCFLSSLLAPVFLLLLPVLFPSYPFSLPIPLPPYLFSFLSFPLTPILPLILIPPFSLPHP